MRRRSDRKTRRFLGKLRRTALAAGALALCAGSAGAAPAGWTVGQESGVFDRNDLEAGVGLDIDGDGLTDLVLEGFDLGIGYGGELRLTPQTVAGMNNEVLGTPGAVSFFADADGVLGAAAPTVAAPGSSLLWSEDGYTAFVDRGFAGFFFEIPDGSPYRGYLDLQIAEGPVDVSIEIFESAFRPVPEPALAWLAASGLLAAGLRRRR